MVVVAHSRLMQFSELSRGSVPVAFGLTLAPGYGQRKYGYNSGNEQSDNDCIGWHVDPLFDFDKPKIWNSWQGFLIWLKNAISRGGF